MNGYHEKLFIIGQSQYSPTTASTVGQSTVTVDYRAAVGGATVGSSAAARGRAFHSCSTL